ncbi:MAG: AtpZ/AtpI family protein [Gammaproteobacteria bacterium]
MKRRQRLGETISQQAERKLRAREENRRTAWFGLGTFGLVGWSVAIPTLLGTALGVWLDGRWPGQVSWTLTFLIIGVALGCLNAWYWINEESNRD